MELPQSIIEKAKYLIETFGKDFEMIGLYQGQQVYKFVFPEGKRTGFPHLYLYNEKTEEVEEIIGMKALTILSSISY